MSTNTTVEGIPGLGPLPPPPPRIEDNPPVIWSKPVVTLLVTTVVFTPIVLACTAVRLWIKRSHGWRWDDVFVVLGVMAMVAKIGVVWGGSHIQYAIAPPMWSFYMMAGLSVLEVYMARLSILSIIYVLAPDNRMKRVVQGVGVIIFIMAAIMICQLFWNCEPQVKAWVKIFPPEYPPFCLVTKSMVITQFIFSILCDLALIGIPLKIFYSVGRDRAVYRRLAGVFFASIVTTIVSMVAGSFNLSHNFMGVLIAGQFEGWLSLLVCSLGILLAAFLRKVYPTTFHTSSATNRNSAHPNSTGITVVTLKTTHVDSKRSNMERSFHDGKKDISSEDLELDHMQKSNHRDDLEAGREKI